MTETSVMDDAEAAIRVLKAVKNIGVMLAIDDFGTGYSSLAYLKRFPVDRVKVDRSFVAGLGVDADDSAIVESIIGLTHAMGMCSVAEGVETHAQLRALHRLGCEFAQGYLFSPAVPPDQVPAVVSRLNRDGTHRPSRREARTP
jgi:EAL domain-containing protein (putative c-di-GMP-specific phosphodiesterase class I)